MNRLYRISALALAAALCLALAACGPKLPGTNSGSSSAVSTPAASGSGSVSGSASVSSGGAGDTMSEGQRYAYAIRDARPAEDNEYSEIACGDAGGEPMLAVNPNDMSAEDAASSIQMMLDTMGIDPATLDAYAHVDDECAGLRHRCVQACRRPGRSRAGCGGKLCFAAAQVV